MYTFPLFATCLQHYRCLYILPASQVAGCCNTFQIVTFQTNMPQAARFLDKRQRIALGYNLFSFWNMFTFLWKHSFAPQSHSFPSTYTSTLRTRSLWRKGREVGRCKEDTWWLCFNSASGRVHTSSTFSLAASLSPCPVKSLLVDTQWCPRGKL